MYITLYNIYVNAHTSTFHPVALSISSIFKKHPKCDVTEIYETNLKTARLTHRLLIFDVSRGQVAISCLLVLVGLTPLCCLDGSKQTDFPVTGIEELRGEIYVIFTTTVTGWWFGCHFLFSHILGIIIPIDQYFSEGWPNHQPDYSDVFMDRIGRFRNSLKRSCWPKCDGPSFLWRCASSKLCRLHWQVPKNMGWRILRSNPAEKTRLLVGGLVAMNSIFPYIGNNHPNWLIFFRGVQTTNQRLIDAWYAWHVHQMEVSIVFLGVHQASLGWFLLRKSPSFEMDGDWGYPHDKTETSKNHVKSSCSIHFPDGKMFNGPVELVDLPHDKMMIFHSFGKRLPEGIDPSYSHHIP